MPRSSKSKYQEEVYKLLQPPSSDDYRLLAVPRTIFSFSGHPMLGLMLGQLLYWTDRAKRKDGFVYKTYQDWYDEVGATEHYIQIFNKLPYIETKRIRANGHPTTHYRIRRDVLEEQIAEYWAKELGKSLIPMPEIEQTISENRSKELGKSRIPLFENEQTIDKNRQIEAGESTDRPRDIPRWAMKIPVSLTYTTTDTTTENTTETTTKITTGLTAKNFYVPDGASPHTALENSNLILEVKELSEMEPETGQALMASLEEMMGAIARVTCQNLDIPDSFKEVRWAAEILLRGRYNPDDVDQFEKYWNERNMRFQKIKILPSPKNIVDQIGISKGNYRRG